MLTFPGAFIYLIVDHWPHDKMAGVKREGNIAKGLEDNANYKTI